MKRSFFKKLIVLTLSIAMLLMSVLPMTIASAAETATVTATPDKNSYAVGDTVVINVDVDNATVKSIGLSWAYDADVLQFVSAEWAIVGAIADVEDDAPRAAFAYEAATLTSGNIFALTFTVLKNDADTTVTVTPVLKNGTTVIEAAAAVATVSFACEHENLGGWVSDETAHWKECECGEVFDKASHDFANACDSECDTCGYIREAADHVYDNACDADCNVCGDPRMVGDHVYDNVCDDTCNECDATREVGDHNYGDWQNVEEGHFKVCIECSEQTATEPHVYDNDCDFDCNVCGATRNVDGHKFSETYTYDENGHWFECTSCGEKTDALEHSFDNDCDAKCDTCGYTREVADHDFGKFQYNDVTHWKACSNCGTISEEGDHKFGEWVEDTAATNTSNGSKHRDCVCGKTETAVIPAIMKFASASLIFESSITINFKVKPEYFTNYGYTDHYVIFSFEDEYGTPYDTKVSEYLIEGSGSSQRYVFEFKGVKSFQMTIPVTATLYATYNGDVYAGTPQPYSVQQYCINQLNKSDKANFKGLLVHFLDYGTEAQLLWDIRTNELANSVVTSEHRAFTNSAVREYSDDLNTELVAVDNPGATWKAAGLLFYDAIIMRMRFVAEDVTGYTCKITSDDGREWIIENEDIKWNAEVSRYEVLFDGLYAFDMSTLVTFTLYDANGNAVSNTLQYSIESYVARNKNEAQTPLLNAMMMYGDSAAIYF